MTMKGHHRHSGIERSDPNGRHSRIERSETSGIQLQGKPIENQTGTA